MSLVILIVVIILLAGGGYLLLSALSKTSARTGSSSSSSSPRWLSRKAFYWTTFIAFILAGLYTFSLWWKEIRQAIDKAWPNWKDSVEFAIGILVLLGLLWIAYTIFKKSWWKHLKKLPLAAWIIIGLAVLWLFTRFEVIIIAVAILLGLFLIYRTRLFLLIAAGVAVAGIALWFGVAELRQHLPTYMEAVGGDTRPSKIVQGYNGDTPEDARRRREANTTPSASPPGSYRLVEINNPKDKYAGTQHVPSRCAVPDQGEIEVGYRKGSNAPVEYQIISSSKSLREVVQLGIADRSYRLVDGRKSAKLRIYEGPGCA